MDVIQILGPSYCGSTVLGYSLNTIDGFFFGSEVRRLLKGFREKKMDGRFPACDYCGKNCEYWSAELLRVIANADDLKTVYDEFSCMHSQVEFFVDASKLVGSYKNTVPFARIICAKHPIRMLASKIYNDRESLNISSEDFGAIKEFLKKNDDKALEYARDYFKYLEVTYKKMFEFDRSAFYFQTDRAHKNDFDLFRSLRIFLGITNRRINVENFSRTPCHSIGGNRAPVSRMKKSHNQSYKNNPRFSFYDSAASYGDWKIDDKYLEVLPDDLLRKIDNLSEYHHILPLLGYDSEHI